MPPPTKRAPGKVDSALGEAITALQEAKKLAKAALRSSKAGDKAAATKTGKEARARLEDARKALSPLLRFKALGPDPGEGPLNRADSDH